MYIYRKTPWSFQDVRLPGVFRPLGRLPVVFRPLAQFIVDERPKAKIKNIHKAKRL